MAVSAKRFQKDLKVDPMFSVEEAGAHLGVSVSWIYNEGKHLIPHYKIGRTLKFRKSDLDEFLERRKVEALGSAANRYKGL